MEPSQQAVVDGLNATLETLEKALATVSSTSVYYHRFKAHHDEIVKGITELRDSYAKPRTPVQPPQAERWDSIANVWIPSPPAVESFLDEYEELCRKHQLCLSHEDTQGAFLVERLNYSRIRWVRKASIGVMREHHRRKG